MKEEGEWLAKLYNQMKYASVTTDETMIEIAKRHQLLMVKSDMGYAAFRFVKNRVDGEKPTSLRDLRSLILKHRSKAPTSQKPDFREDKKPPRRH